jgi:hypothetical protein
MTRILEDFIQKPSPDFFKKGGQGFTIQLLGFADLDLLWWIADLKDSVSHASSEWKTILQIHLRLRKR